MDRIDELKKLKALLDNGFITQEELNCLKAEILGKELKVISDSVENAEATSNDDTVLKSEDTLIEKKETESIPEEETPVVAKQDKTKQEKSHIKLPVPDKEVNTVATKKLACKKCGKEISDYINRENKGVCIDCKEKPVAIPKWAYLFLLLLIPLGWWFLKDSPEKTIVKESSASDVQTNIVESNLDKLGEKKGGDSDISLKLFVNKPFMYEIYYPSSFQVNDNGGYMDNIIFRNEVDNEEKLQIQCNELIDTNLEEAFISYYNYILNSDKFNVTYKSFKNNWFVVSGYLTENNYVFYKKGYYKDYYSDFINIITFTYPKSKKEIYDSMVSEILESFKEIETTKNIGLNKTGYIKGTDVIIRQSPSASSKIIGSFKNSGEKVTILDKFIDGTNKTVLLNKDVSVEVNGKVVIIEKGKAIKVHVKNSDGSYIVYYEDAISRSNKNLKVTSDYLDFTNNIWYEISSTSGQEGWVFGKFILLDENLKD